MRFLNGILIYILITKFLSNESGNIFRDSQVERHKNKKIQVTFLGAWRAVWLKE